MENNIKTISIKEFREKGYLQELNRQFLHPLGLALSVKINEDGTEILDTIWDYRDDEEGITYDINGSDANRINEFKKKRDFILNESNKRNGIRNKKLGFIIEPIR